MFNYRKNKTAFILNIFAAVCVLLMLSDAAAAGRSRIRHRWNKRLPIQTFPIPIRNIDRTKLCLREEASQMRSLIRTVVPSYPT